MGCFAALCIYMHLLLTLFYNKGQLLTLYKGNGRQNIAYAVCLEAELSVSTEHCNPCKKQILKQIGADFVHTALCTFCGI